MHASLTLELPETIGAEIIQVAEISRQNAPAMPVGFSPLTGPKPDRRRLPPDVVRISGVTPGATGAVRKVAAADEDALGQLAGAVGMTINHPTEIRGASLLVPQAGETTRVLTPRGAMIEALAARDFDPKATTMLGDTRAEIAAVPLWQARGVQEVYARDRAYGAQQEAAAASLAGAPPASASRAELGWQRRAVARVSNVVVIGPSRITHAATRIASWAVLQQAAYVQPQPHRSARKGNTGSVRGAVKPMPADRAADPGRQPGRARSDDLEMALAA